MSHLNDQRAMATALFTAAAQVVREIEAEARARQAQRRPSAPTPRPVEPPEPDVFDDHVADSCTCDARRYPPCSWCTSDDTPLNAEDVPA